jgi:hypothetical protein
MSHDGLVVGGSEDMAESVEQLKFTFSEKAHIYDVREGSYLGETDSVNTTLAAGDAKVLAILPEKLDRVECAIPADVKPGESFELKIAAYTASGKTPESSVFAVEIKKPSGIRAWEYCENVACAGKTELIRKLPYNAEPGTWTVSIKDAATAVQTNFRMVVKA